MKTKITIPDTDITIHPLGLGTVNAGLAWDEKETGRIIDTFLDMGGNLLDTAHVYSDWVKPERARSDEAQWQAQSDRACHKGRPSGYDGCESGHAHQQDEAGRHDQ